MDNLDYYNMHDTTPTDFTCSDEEVEEAKRNGKELYYLFRWFSVQYGKSDWANTWSIRKAVPSLKGVYYNNYWHAYGEATRRNAKTTD